MPQVADVCTCDYIRSYVCGYRRQAVEPGSRSGFEPDVRSLHVLCPCEHRSERSLSYRSGIHSHKHVHHRAVGADGHLIYLILRQPVLVADGLHHLVDRSDYGLLELAAPVLRVLYLVGDPCQDIEPEELLSVDLGCMSEFLARKHVDKRTYNGGRSYVYCDSVQRPRRISLFERDDLSVVQHGSILSRQHLMLAESRVIEADISGRSVVSDDILSAGLFYDLVLERGLVLESRLMDRDRPLLYVCLKFEIRHIARGEHIMLLFLLKELYAYVPCRESKAGQSDALSELFGFQYAALCLARLTGFSFCDPDPALSAEPFAAAGVVYEKSRVEHYLHQIFAGGKIVFLSLRHNCKFWHY